MSSRQRKSRSEIVFLLLTIIIIMGGYIIMGNDTLLESAAVVKTGKVSASAPIGKAYTTPANDSSSSSDTASYQPNQSNPYVHNPNPTFYSSNTSNTASNQTTIKSLNTSSAEQPPQNETNSLAENRTLSHQTTAQNHTISSFTSTNNDISAEQPQVPVSKATSSLNITATEVKSNSITLIINNPTSTALLVEPAIEEIAVSLLPHERRVKELLAEELQQEGKDATPQNIEQEWQMLQLLEKEKVKPIYTIKVFHPWNFITTNAVTSLTYTGKRSSGQLLKLQAPLPFTVPASQQTRQVIFFPTAVSAVDRQAKLKLMVQGNKEYETNFTVPASFSAAVKVDRNNNLVDVYLSIPSMQDGFKHEYLLEMQVKNKQGTVYYELFGPYSVSGNENALFSQEFHYDPHIIYGREMVTLTIFQEGLAVKKIEQEEEFDEGKI